MAKAPGFSGIKADDVAEAPDWFKNLLPQLNGFFTDTTSALDGGLSGENSAEYSTTLTLKTDGSGQPLNGLTFGQGVAGTPAGLRVEQVRPLDKGGGVAGAVDASHWVASGGQITVQTLTGLHANSNYALTLTVKPAKE